MFEAGTAWRKKKQSKNMVFIGGIPLDSTKIEILNFLEQYDRVVKLEMPKENYLSTLKGYAKAALKTSDGVERLLAQPHHFLKNLQVSVKRWINKAEHLREKDEISMRKLFVRYHPIYTRQELLEHFKVFGYVETLDAKKDPRTNMDRYIAYVTYSAVDEAVTAAHFGNIIDKDWYITCEITTPSYVINLENTSSLCTTPLWKDKYANTTKKGTFPSFEPLDVQRIKSFATDSYPTNQQKIKEIKSTSQVKKKSRKKSDNILQQNISNPTVLSKILTKKPGHNSLWSRERLSSVPIAEEFFQFHDTKPTSSLYIYPEAINRGSMANLVFRKLLRMSNSQISNIQ
jgi:RNA recognition motif-containing protein